MSSHDEEAPPVSMPPVRRDPRLGWEQSEPERAAPEPDSYVRGIKLGARAVAVLVVVVGVIVLIFLAGLTAHGIWRALLLGWGIG